MPDWISSSIIYQVNLRSLAAREPRNAFEAVGEEPCSLSPLAYVTQHLETIKRLGATVVYLMPPYPIGRVERKGIGSPYASRNFCAVDREYGAIDELGGLVRHAHELGLKVILDITPNHTSRDHVWTESNPEFYVRNDDGSPFYDADWTDTAKLDYTQPALRQAMVDVYDFWLTLLGTDADGDPDGVDGFRLDMAHFINDRSFWDDALPELRGRHPGRRLLFLAECYGVGNNLELFGRGVDAAYDDDLYKVCQYCYALGEASGAGSGSAPERTSMIRLSPEAELNQDFADKLAAFREGGIAGAFGRALLSYEEREGAFWLARYTDNHDEGRGVFRFGEGAVRAVNRLLFMSPRTIPFILTGQEFGAMNRPSIHERMGTCDKGRRVLRAEGVHEEAGVEFEGNLFARGRDRRRAWYAFYRELIDLRRDTPELIDGTFAVIDAGEAARGEDRSVLAFDRELGGSVVRCAVNLGPEPRALENAGLLGGDVLYGGLDGDTLGAFEAVVVRG